MSEAVYNAAGLGLPIVMTVANRAIGAPINIWNDHRDAMSQRDAGWLQLYAETNRKPWTCTSRRSGSLNGCRSRSWCAWTASCSPTPASGWTSGPAQVDAFLPRYDPRQVLDPAEPVSIGAMVGPEAFTEVRYLAYERMQQALAVIPAVAEEFAAEFGRASGGLVRPYLTEDADIVMVALGSVLGTAKDMVDELRADGMKVGVLGITSYRPFPLRAVRETLTRANRHLIVLERALAPGTGGIVTADLQLALAGNTRGGSDRRGRPRRPRDHERGRCAACWAGRPRASSSRSASSTWIPGSWTGTGPDARRAPVRPEPRRTSSATWSTPAARIG